MVIGRGCSLVGAHWPAAKPHHAVGPWLGVPMAAAPRRHRPLDRPTRSHLPSIAPLAYAELSFGA